MAEGIKKEEQIMELDRNLLEHASGGASHVSCKDRSNECPANPNDLIGHRFIHTDPPFVTGKDGLRYMMARCHYCGLEKWIADHGEWIFEDPTK